MVRLVISISHDLESRYFQLKRYPQSLINAVENGLTIFNLEAEKSGDFSPSGVVWSQRKEFKVEIVIEYTNNRGSWRTKTGYKSNSVREENNYNRNVQYSISLF